MVFIKSVRMRFTILLTVVVFVFGAVGAETRADLGAFRVDPNDPVAAQIHLNTTLDSDEEGEIPYYSQTLSCTSQAGLKYFAFIPCSSLVECKKNPCARGGMCRAEGVISGYPCFENSRSCYNLQTNLPPPGTGLLVCENSLGTISTGQILKTPTDILETNTDQLPQFFRISVSTVGESDAKARKFNKEGAVLAVTDLTEKRNIIFTTDVLAEITCTVPSFNIRRETLKMYAVRRNGTRTEINPVVQENRGSFTVIKSAEMFRLTNDITGIACLTQIELVVYQLAMRERVLHISVRDSLSYLARSPRDGLEPPAVPDTGDQGKNENTASEFQENMLTQLQSIADSLREILRQVKLHLAE